MAKEILDLAQRGTSAKPEGVNSVTQTLGVECATRRMFEMSDVLWSRENIAQSGKD
jgi:hypothetical protein